MKFLQFFGIWIISVCLSPLAYAGAAGVPDAIAGELAKAKSEGKLLLVRRLWGLVPLVHQDGSNVE